MQTSEKESERLKQSLAAERAVLGAVLADNTLLTAVAEVVSAEDFASPAHTQIFAAMLKLDGAGKPVDHLTLSEELKLQGQLLAVGGPAYLMRLDQVVPLASNAVQYAHITKSHADRRRLGAVGRDIQAMAEADTGDVDALMAEAERKVFGLGERRQQGELRPMSELLEPALDMLDRMKQSSSAVTGLATGYIDLDEMLTGLHPGELIILAARPGLGKTSLALNIAVHAALNEGKAAGIFSLEMPAEQLVTRMLSAQARVDMRKLRGGRLSPHEEEKLQETAGAVYNAPLYIDDTGTLSPFELRAKARRMKQRDSRTGILVIDYLQLMSLQGAESRQQEVSEISRALKQLAKELEVPIVALSQLSRKVEERKKGRPMLSDLRESGSIEQDADVVLFIHHEGDEDGEKGEEVASNPNGPVPVELIVAKQRNGPVGEVKLLFMREYTRFENRERQRG